MNFEFIPFKDITNMYDYLNYECVDRIGMNILKLSLKIPYVIVLFFLSILFLTTEYDSFWANIVIGYILILICTIVLFLTSNFFVKKMNINGFNKRDYMKIKSTFKIEDNYLIRKNDLMEAKILINSISNIYLMKSTLIITSEISSQEVVIPISCIPVSLNEFLNIFTSINSSINIIDLKKKRKLNIVKRFLLVTLIFLLSITPSYFICKYKFENNFTKYNLIEATDLKQSTNNERIYTNNNLKFTLHFPSSWGDNYGIEELDYKVNVYYLYKGKQGPYTTLLFSIEKGLLFDDTDSLSLNRVVQGTHGGYTLFALQKVSNIKKNSIQYEEYQRLFEDIKNLLLE